MKKQLFSLGALVVGFMIGASALTALAQTGTWTAPSNTPPVPNVAAPINVGANPQIKTGLLTLANFMFNPTGVADVVPGSVLTAQNANGLVGWGAPGGSGGGINFSGAGIVYNATILGNGNTTFVKVAANGTKGVALNINKGSNTCGDLKVELYSQAGANPNLPTYRYGSEYGANDFRQYQYLGYIFGGTDGGDVVRQMGDVIIMPVSPTGYIMLKSNTNQGTPCAVTITKIADIN